jgi:hypothetical protein
MLAPFTGHQAPRRSSPPSPHEAVMEALVRLLERTCPLPANRTLPNNIREVLTRLRSHRRLTPARPGKKGDSSGLIRKD